jgi:L-asparaginase
VPLDNPSFIGGSNLTATKARLLLMACLMKFGALPPAANPDQSKNAFTAAPFRAHQRASRRALA